MSNPPTSSPLMINCGNVGQSLSFLRPKGKCYLEKNPEKYTCCACAPWRTPSSVRISKCVNRISRSCRIPTIFLENPHRGASGEPFMNKTTLLWFIKVRKRFSSSSVDTISASCDAEGRPEGASAGLWSVCESGRYEEFDACFARSCVKLTASAPSILPSNKCPYIQIICNE